MLSPKQIEPANLEHDAVKRQTLRYFNTGSISFDVILCSCSNLALINKRNHVRLRSGRNFDYGPLLGCVCR